MTRILVVEDDAVVREVICEVLNVNGYETEEAADGEAGLEILAQQSFDLAVVDIWMPKVDGLSLLRNLRTRLVDLPIIIVSGGGPNNTLEHSVAIADTYGADAVLFKPFEDFELIDAVTAVLEK